MDINIYQLIRKEFIKRIFIHLSISTNIIYNIRFVFLILLILTISNRSESQTTFIRGQQFGSDKDEYVLNHVIDNKGNVYVAGKTNGVMEAINYGKYDGFITKIDSLGNTVWTKQFGTAEEEDIQWSAIDNYGCVYITGSTTGVLNDKQFGKEDIFIVKYNPDGKMEWAQQFGTEGSDIAKGICSDNSGYIYVTGMTDGKLGESSSGKTDGFIIKLDNKGNRIFTSQFGTSGDDYSYSITAGNNSDIYICGSTWGDIAAKNQGNIDGFTGHFTNNGKLIGFSQFGSEGFDIAMILKVDEKNNIYVGGSTSGNFGCQQIGEGDCFFLKLNEKGDILWNDQFGTAKHDGVRGIDLNSEISDNILISGLLNLPPAQAFIRMYMKDGKLLWERNSICAGKNGDSSGKDVHFDNKGNFYHVGLTSSSLYGSLHGESDFYLVKMGLDKSYRH